MSTLVTNTITGLSTAANITIGSTPVVSASANSLTIRGEGSAQTSVQQGLAKAWVEGSDAAAPQDSFNIASGTDGGVGTYSYAIANDMSSIAYSINVCAHSVCVALTNDDSQTASVFTCDLFQKASLGDRGDRPNYSTIHGDLA
jgi:hypothetical protein